MYLGVRRVGLRHRARVVFVVDEAFTFRGRRNWDVNPKALIRLALAVSERLLRWHRVQYDSCERPIRVATGHYYVGP